MKNNNINISSRQTHPWPLSSGREGKASDLSEVGVSSISAKRTDMKNSLLEFNKSIQ